MAGSEPHALPDGKQRQFPVVRCEQWDRLHGLGAFEPATPPSRPKTGESCGSFPVPIAAPYNQKTAAAHLAAGSPEQRTRQLEDKISPDRVCYHCRQSDVPKLLSCAACIKVGRWTFYCNPEHQKSDWQRHRVICGKSYASVAFGPVPTPRIVPTLNPRRRLILDTLAANPSACWAVDRGHGEIRITALQLPPFVQNPAALCKNLRTTTFSALSCLDEDSKAVMFLFLDVATAGDSTQAAMLLEVYTAAALECRTRKRSEQHNKFPFSTPAELDARIMLGQHAVGDLAAEQKRREGTLWDVD
ncbi:hypothetical protein JCM10213_000803 [Rhodosporidiobolus nylandii]